MQKKRIVTFEKRRTLTLAEIEEFYGIAQDTLRKWIKRDGSDGVPALESFKPGKEILIFREVLEEYIRRFPAA